MWRVGPQVGNEVVRQMVADRSYVDAHEVNAEIWLRLCQFFSVLSATTIFIRGHDLALSLIKCS